MRRLIAAVAAAGMAGLLCVAALAAPPKEDGGPLDGFAKLTRGTRKACFVVKFDCDWGGEKSVGDAKLWFDTARGLYRVQTVMTGTVSLGDKAPIQVTGEINRLLGPDGTVEWEKEDGKLSNARKREKEKTVPGKREVLGNRWPETLIVDAAFGYEHLASEAILKPAKAPQEDKLRWFELEPNPKVKDGKLAGSLQQKGHGVEAKVLIGFSPESGWPMKMVFSGKDINVAFEITKIDLKPELEGVFDLPAEVKDKLGGKRENGGN